MPRLGKKKVRFACHTRSRRSRFCCDKFPARLLSLVCDCCTTATIYTFLRNRHRVRPEQEDLLVVYAGDRAREHDCECTGTRLTAVCTVRKWPNAPQRVAAELRQMLRELDYTLLPPSRRQRCLTTPPAPSPKPCRPLPLLTTSSGNRVRCALTPTRHLTLTVLCASGSSVLTPTKSGCATPCWS